MKFQQSFLQVPPEAPTQEDGGETFQDGCNDSRGKVYKSRGKELSKTEVFHTFCGRLPHLKNSF